MREQFEYIMICYSRAKRAMFKSGGRLADHVHQTRVSAGNRKAATSLRS